MGAGGMATLEACLAIVQSADERRNQPEPPVMTQSFPAQFLAAATPLPSHVSLGASAALLIHGCMRRSRLAMRSSTVAVCQLSVLRGTR